MRRIFLGLSVGTSMQWVYNSVIGVVLIVLNST